jgi:hypothetical protein
MKNKISMVHIKEHLNFIVQFGILGGHYVKELFFPT